VGNGLWSGRERCASKKKGGTERLSRCDYQFHPTEASPADQSFGMKRNETVDVIRQAAAKGPALELQTVVGALLPGFQISPKPFYYRG
jgi:hypothetical protein